MENKIKDLLSKMTLEEKVSFCSGHDAWHAESLERLGIPEIMMCDGPHGLRKRDKNENGEYGKTEMWYVMEADEGAGLIYGFKKDITQQEFAKAIEDQTLEEVVNWIPVKKGDTFFIPAGTLHAIGAGILIAEIQQNSDTTYRVYDFGRLGLDGKPRELHTEKAKQVTDLSSSLGKEFSDIDAGVCCEFFKTRCQKGLKCVFFLFGVEIDVHIHRDQRDPEKAQQIWNIQDIFFPIFHGNFPPLAA